MKYTPNIENIREGKPFYVVAVCFPVDVKNERILLLKRAKTQMIHGGLWAPIGGKLEWSDLTNHAPSRDNGTVEDWLDIVELLLKREAMEEANIKVDDFKYIGSVAYVRPDGMPSVCLKFACRYLDGDIHFPDDFEEARWFACGELEDGESILGVPEEIAISLDSFKMSTTV
ncbi:NUDIX domain-containing protein [Candidatus Uhrbacteria bacterium]|nr:NUDIX domain-containing protein [Candidatus Uhrbacteria bacterium]